jgi:hypothetical protein
LEQADGERVFQLFNGSDREQICQVLPTYSMSESMPVCATELIDCHGSLKDGDKNDLPLFKKPGTVLRCGI